MELNNSKCTHLLIKLEELGACDRAIAWIKKRRFTSLQEAWDNCTRPVWMVWLLETKNGKSDRLLNCLRAVFHDNKIARSHVQVVKDLKEGEHVDWDKLILENANLEYYIKNYFYARNLYTIWKSNLWDKPNIKQCEIIRKYYPKAPRGI